MGEAITSVMIVGSTPGLFGDSLNRGLSGLQRAPLQICMELDAIHRVGNAMSVSICAALCIGMETEFFPTRNSKFGRNLYLVLGEIALSRQQIYDDRLLQ